MPTQDKPLAAADARLGAILTHVTSVPDARGPANLRALNRGRLAALADPSVVGGNTLSVRIGDAYVPVGDPAVQRLTDEQLADALSQVRVGQGDAARYFNRAAHLDQLSDGQDNAGSRLAMWVATDPAGSPLRDDSGKLRDVLVTSPGHLFTPEENRSLQVATAGKEDPQIAVARRFARDAVSPPGPLAGGAASVTVVAHSRGSGPMLAMVSEFSNHGVAAQGVALEPLGLRQAADHVVAHEQVRIAPANALAGVSPLPGGLTTGVALVQALDVAHREQAVFGQQTSSVRSLGPEGERTKVATQKVAGRPTANLEVGELHNLRMPDRTGFLDQNHRLSAIIGRLSEEHLAVVKDVAEKASRWGNTPPEQNMPAQDGPPPIRNPSRSR